MYHGKDVYMLIVAKTIILSLQKYLSELAAVRTNWTVQFVTDFIARIENAMEKYLGLDKKKALRMAVSNASAIFSPARRDLSSIKIQLMEDFKYEPDKLAEITRSLGLPKTLKKIKNSDMETLINHLYAFKKGMTDELKAEIVAKGTNPAIIERMISYATELADASQARESVKESGEELNDETLKELNGIYSEIIKICKIASNFC
ncbi:MAG: hypothetical protein HC831_03730 [Chloroflexia bacterium]|nr:hypothetical protein [Chloroflexia bacterium]